MRAVLGGMNSMQRTSDGPVSVVGCAVGLPKSGIVRTHIYCIYLHISVR